MLSLGEMKTRETSGRNYSGIYYMLLAALGFSLMGAFAKLLKTSFNAPQLVFYRNLIGIAFLAFSLWQKPVKQEGGRLGLLIFRGVMGTLALYTLLYNIIHIPLGAALTYNTINTFYIAILSGWLLKEKLSGWVWTCIVIGFGGVLLIYKPSGDFSWTYHGVGIVHGLFSAFAYLSISSLNKYYDTRIIVLSFLVSGLVLPTVMMGLGAAMELPADDFFFPEFRIPEGGREYFYLLGMGLTALLGQYFVTKAYSNDKAGIVAAIGYSNIVLAMALGILLGDSLPDWIGITGVLLVIGSGVAIALRKRM